MGKGRKIDPLRWGILMELPVTDVENQYVQVNIVISVRQRWQIPLSAFEKPAVPSANGFKGDGRMRYISDDK